MCLFVLAFVRFFKIYFPTFFNLYFCERAFVFARECNYVFLFVFCFAFTCSPLPSLISFVRVCSLARERKCIRGFVCIVFYLFIFIFLSLVSFFEHLLAFDICFLFSGFVTEH